VEKLAKACAPSILLATAAGWLAFCYPTAQAADWVETFRSAKLETEEDVQLVVSHAAASKRAIMFINIDWAILGNERKRFAEFMVAYHHKHQDDPVLFHYVDCTPVTSGYYPLRSLSGWKELESTKGTSLVHGWGEVVWMEHGHVLHVERILNFDTTQRLIEITESLLPPN